MNWRERTIASLIRVHTGLLTTFGGIFHRAGDTGNSAHANILVFRLDELGDVVLTTSLLSEIRRNFPGASVEVVVQPALRSILENSPLVDRVSTFDPSAPRLLRPLVLPFRAMRWRRRHRDQRAVNIAINARPGPDSAYAGFLAYISGAPIRIGVTEYSTARKAILNAGFDRFYTHVVGDRRVIHDADAALALLQPLGIAPLGADATLSSTDVGLPLLAGIKPESPAVAMCVSGGHSSLKRWPIDRFQQVASILHSRLGATIVIVGTRDDAELATGVAWPPGTIDLTGRTSLKEMTSVLSLVDAYIGGDIGPTHIAAAVGTPTIALFGSSVPSIYAPRSASATVLYHEFECNPGRAGTTADRAFWRADYTGPERCTNCIFDTVRCMESLTVTEVVDAATQRLAASPVSAEIRD